MGRVQTCFQDSDMFSIFTWKHGERQDCAPCLLPAAPPPAVGACEEAEAAAEPRESRAASLTGRKRESHRLRGDSRIWPLSICLRPHFRWQTCIRSLLRWTPWGCPWPGVCCPCCCSALCTSGCIVFGCRRGRAMRAVPGRLAARALGAVQSEARCRIAAAAPCAGAFPPVGDPGKRAKIGALQVPKLWWRWCHGALPLLCGAMTWQSSLLTSSCMWLILESIVPSGQCSSACHPTRDTPFGCCRRLLR